MDYNCTNYLTTTKDVEHAFSSNRDSQSRQDLARFRPKEILHDIMSACIIMHEMVIEDEGDLGALIAPVNKLPTIQVKLAVDEDARFQQFFRRYRQIRDRDAHLALRNDLIDHM